jgi:hypothetical protein
MPWLSCHWSTSCCSTGGAIQFHQLYGGAAVLAAKMTSAKLPGGHGLDPALYLAHNAAASSFQFGHCWSSGCFFQQRFSITSSRQR